MLLACHKAPAFTPISPQTMMEAVRSYARPAEPAEVPKAKPVSQKTGSAEPPLQTESEYERQIIGLSAVGDYEELEKEARDARASKGRVIGGSWRILEFYEALTNPPTGSRATEADWNAHIEAIKRWNNLHPESATARIVLAGSYVNFAWFARGHGYSDSVSRNSWELFGQRFELAKGALLEAARLKDKCPYWSELVQMTALAEGWDKPLATEIFEKAAAFEPTYYHFYREYANYLQPKWYGEEGETQKFAEQAANHVGGDDGDMIYFEIASLVACQCQAKKTQLEGLSWPRIQLGYLAMRQHYDMSNRKLNRFALVAYSSDDRPAANQAFIAIGEDWDYTVWRSQQTFEEAKAWAAAP